MIEANPRLCTVRPNVQHRLKLGNVIQRGKTNGHESRIGIAAREQRRAASRAKAACRDTTAAGANRVRLRRTSDLDVRDGNDKPGSKRGSAGTLTIHAVAIEHCDGRARAQVSNRPTCTPASEWNSHIEVTPAI